MEVTKREDSPDWFKRLPDEYSDYIYVVSVYEAFNNAASRHRARIDRQLDYFKIVEDVRIWLCAEMAFDVYFHEPLVYFKNEADVIMFKLHWA